MILRRLPPIRTFSSKAGVPSYIDHCLFAIKAGVGMQYPEHFTGLGIITILRGEASCVVNKARLSIDENSFLIVNRGSTLSFKLQAGTHLCLLYFNSHLSDILSTGLLNKSTSTPGISTASDFSLLEHVHYQNASLKSHFALLLDLGNSCSSFHALKADMVIRSMLDGLLAKNHEAIRLSANLEVVKTTTRVNLFKRLQLARLWMEQNYAAPLTLTQVADIAMLNQEHFLRMFKQAFQQTPHQYLTELRIEKAKLLLKSSSEPVFSISLQLGFESLSSFSGLFKRKVGSTPGEFRRAAEKQHA